LNLSHWVPAGYEFLALQAKFETYQRTRAAFKAASATASTLIPFMHRKSMGHSRKKQGEHAASDARI
jgi:hypothetical protein